MDMSLFTGFEGRINRVKWWLGLIVLMVAQWIAWFVLSLVFGLGTMMSDIDPADPAAMERIMSGMWVPIVIVILIFIYPALAIYTKRWHDRNKSGWWTLIAFVPLIGGIWIFVELGCLRGTDGPNQYGPDPLRA